MDSQYDEISLLESDGESEGAWETSSEGEEGCFMGLAPLNLDEAFASEATASEATASEATASEGEFDDADQHCDFESQGNEFAGVHGEFESEAETFCAPCGNECAICMDDIGASNCTVTECGHRFHSSCIFRNMMERIECPMCRKDLVDMPEEEEDDEEEFDGEDDESDSDGDNESVDEGERDLTCKQMADKLQSLGYTMADVLYYATTYRHSSEAERFNNDLDDRIGGLIDRMLDGELAVDHRDGRTYAQVLANQPPPPQVPQQAPQPQAPQPQAPPHAYAEPKSPRRRRPEFFEPAPSLEAI
jgi:hypothetical protein